MIDVSLIQKELSELTGRKARLGSPEEDERLQDLERQIAEHEARLADLLSQIAELEAKVGWTAEEEAERARLQGLIDEEEANVAGWQAKIIELEAQVPFWKARLDTAKSLQQAYRNYIERSYWEKRAEFGDCPFLMRILPAPEAKSAYSGAWGAEAIELVSLDRADPVLPIAPEQKTFLIPFKARSTKEEWRIPSYKELIDKCISGEAGTPEVRPVVALAVQEVLWEMGITYPPQLNVLAKAQEYIDSLHPQISHAERRHYELYTELRNARDELERAKRRLWDAKAAKERYELAITRAIALRQAEVDAAKARYELELRTLDNLKATHNVLLKEIEAARTQAIAEAARQREEVIKAKEKDRLSIAEEQRRIAEEYERLAAESVGMEREEYLEKMRRALEIAEEAEEAAIAAALEREALAVDIALRKAELARIELELEELRKQQEIAEERKEEAEEKIVPIYGIPKWGWVALGIGGTALTATGIGYALKKKKKR